MSDSLRRQMELFEAAVDLPPERREAFLRQECGQDTRLLEAVLQQLAKDAELGDEPPETTADPFIGTTVGPYRVKSLLGEGGYGSVYLAERKSPMVQQVALKIIRAGRDSKSVLARFDQERQALALMDHPNIARVFDAGSTPDGRPYFVMEYVAGEPITEFCDANRLTVSQRLELFISVCEAVQHAHQKAIIHRDIKPRNILVSKVDGKPVAKVIDFGIAKATGERLIDQTIETMQGIAVGTLLYMSPEQADGGKQDVDTRSDVYSLGVVLYELLAGILPHDAQTLLAAGQAEMHRIIREVDPPKPSTRLETIDGQTGTAIGTARGEDRSKLAGRLRKELEWIPMMALRKDRARRYGSAAAMAADVRRYLEGKPLDAAPESRAYLVRKFVRRNRVVVGAVGAVLLTLSIGVVTTGWGLLLAEKNAKAERAAKIEAKRKQAVAEAFSNLIREDIVGLGVENVRPDAARLLSDAAGRIAERFKDEPQLRAELSIAFGEALLRAGDPRNAVLLFEQASASAVELDPTTRLQLSSGLADAKLRQSISDRDLASLRAAITRASEQAGPRAPLTLSLRNDLAGLLKNQQAASEPIGQANLDESERIYNEVLTDRTAVLGSAHVDTLITRHNLALLDLKRARKAFKDLPADQAIASYKQALGNRKRVTQDTEQSLGLLHPQSLASLAEQVALTAEAGRLEPQLLSEAVDQYPSVLGKLWDVLGYTHFRSLELSARYAQALNWAGRYNESATVASSMVEAARPSLGATAPLVRAATSLLVEVHEKRGAILEAERLLLRCHDDAVQQADEQASRNAACVLAAFYSRSQRLEDAARWTELCEAPGGAR